MIAPVRYVPELKKNHLSIGTLDKIGYEIQIQNGHMKVVSGSLTVLKANLRIGIYILEGTTVFGVIAVAK